MARFFCAPVLEKPRQLADQADVSNGHLKRSKKPLVLRSRRFLQRAQKGTKVFWFFFSKKNCLLAFFLSAPLAQAATIDLSARVAQHGAFAGVRNTVFTRWLPAGEAVSALSGTISLAGNAPGFDEALVVLGTSSANRQDCDRANMAVVPAVPELDRLWGGILKSNDPAPVSIPVGVRLRTPVAVRDGRGACLVSVVSAGYPILRRDLPLYADTDVKLLVQTVPAPSGQAASAFGIGGEFRFRTGADGGVANYVGLRAARPLVVDGVALSLSVAPVSGAPAQAGWGPDLRGTWRVSTDFLVLPRVACAAAALSGHQANADFSVLRLGKPAGMAMPRGGDTVLRVPLVGKDMVAAQVSGFHTFSPEMRLQPGDCLLAFAQTRAEGASGKLDVENQSTVYVRPGT